MRMIERAERQNVLKLFTGKSEKGRQTDAEPRYNKKDGRTVNESAARAVQTV